MHANSHAAGGLRTADAATIEKVYAKNNAELGVSADDDASMRDVSARKNGADGIKTRWPLLGPAK